MAPNPLSSKPLRVVIDPTVMVGALLDSQGECARLLDHVAQHRVQLVLDETVRDALAGALNDPDAQEQGQWSPSEAQRWLNALEILAVESDAPDLSVKESSATSSLESSEASGQAAAALAGDLRFFALARDASAVLVTIDPATLAQSGALGVDVVKPQTVNDVLAARLRPSGRG